VQAIMAKGTAIPSDYVEKFIQAERTFLHQRVWDMERQALVPLTPYPLDLDPGTLDYAGAY
jgi:hypothetical protein